jgi:hypothetical protein
MTMKQRIILILGGIGILHSSMVPPVSQLEAVTCRYHEFVERSLFFTRGYGVNHGDTVALISEYGIIVALTGIAYLIAGARKKSSV